jgi:sensor histidine kinase YesM
MWVLLTGKGPFLIFFSLAQCIGFFICTFGHLFFSILKPATALKQIILLAICVVIGCSCGLFLFSFLFNIEITEFYSYLFVGCIFGMVISYFFIAHEKISQLKIAKQEEELKSIFLEKENIQANLRSLQAQIEPHFLFNSLSTILSLLDTDVKTGKHMLENLTRFLRTSLKHSRKEHNTLEYEIKTIESYLEINKIRMRERLKFTITMPEKLNNFSFPPMLIQPIVENAIKHGIEPKVEGGTILISITEQTNYDNKQRSDKLVIKIADTGAGLSSDLSFGMGLNNVKARLKALYGDKAYLSFKDNKPCGLIVQIKVPLWEI